MSLQLDYNVRKGHHLVMQAQPNSVTLPPWMIQVQRQAKRWRCSTEQLLSLSQRNAESMNEVLILTDRVLEAFAMRVVGTLPPLQKLNDALTTIDLLLAFAAVARDNKHYSKFPKYRLRRLCQ